MYQISIQLFLGTYNRYTIDQRRKKKKKKKQKKIAKEARVWEDEGGREGCDSWSNGVAMGGADTV